MTVGVIELSYTNYMYSPFFWQLTLSRPPSDGQLLPPNWRPPNRWTASAFSGASAMPMIRESARSDWRARSYGAELDKSSACRLRARTLKYDFRSKFPV